MNSFCPGRVRVGRLHATGACAVSPGDDGFGAFGSLAGDLQGAFAADTAITFVFRRNRTFNHKQVFTFIFLHGLFLGSFGLFAGGSHQGFRIIE